MPDDGTEVVRQRDPGDRFYIVEAGAAEVLIDGFVVGIVGPGDSFGERALLRDVPRAATVRSIGAMQLFVLARQDFLAALTGQEGAPAASYGSPSPAVALEWTQSERAELLSRVSLFSHLDSKAVGALSVRGVIDRWPQGASIIRQGEKGDRFFVMLEGRATVSVDAKRVNELRPGDEFGEIALLHDVPRSADVVTSTPAVTLSLHRNDVLPAVRARLLLG